MTSKLRYTNTNRNLLQKASAVKFGWLVMEWDGRWFWFNKKPQWAKEGYWWHNGYCLLENVKFLKLPKRKPSFAPLSLIKCTARGTILLSAGCQYHRTWGMISIETTNNINYLSKERKR